MSSFHFIRPWWLLMLMPVIFWLVRIFLYRSEKEQWKKVCDAHLLPYLLIGTPAKQRYFPIILLSVAWMITVLALAGPSWTRVSNDVYRSNIARIIVLDLSESMLVKDVFPNRLTRAKYKIEDILQKSRVDNVGLVVFSGEAFVASPLTQDTETIRSMLPQLNLDIMPIQGNHIGLALQKAAELMKQAKMKKGEIILLTASLASEEDLAIAAELNGLGFTVSVLVVGLENGAVPIRNSDGNVIVAKLEKRKLEKLADMGGGAFAMLSSDDDDLQTILVDNFSSHALSGAEKQKVFSVKWEDQGYWLVLILIPLALLAFRRGWFSQILQ